MKKNVLKIALMGLAMGSMMTGCSGTKSDDAEQNSSSCAGKTGCKGKTACKGQNGCTGKTNCTGSSGCKGQNGCTGKSDCAGGNGNSSQNSNPTNQMQQKRETAAKTINSSK